MSHTPGTLYVTDLDGTLLNNGSMVSQHSAKILSDLSDSGALITVATARTPATVVPLMQGTGTRVPFIVMTGAAMYDPLTKSYNAASHIPTGDALTAMSIFNEYGINPFVYRLTSDSGTLSVYHHPQMTAQEREFYEPRARLKLKRFTFELPPEPNADIILFFATGKTEQIRPLGAALESTGKLSVSVYPDIFACDVSIVEVYAAGVSKASAISKLAGKLGVDRVVCFGDNLNDIPMFEVADLSVAVDNAFPQVKDSADIIIGPNYDDSVAHFIADDFHGQ